MKKLFFSAIIGISTLAIAQENRDKNIDFQVKGTVSLGGSSPMGWGLPREIRKIESFNPTFNAGGEVNATKWFSEKWGVRLGVSLNSKGMKTKANVKNYHTEVIQDDGKLEGYYTGLVKTDVRNTYITVPISVVYQLKEDWNLYAGLFFGGTISKKFEGYVTDGYLHQNTPVGQKILFEDRKAYYDYSNEINGFQWGAQIGAEWYMNKYLFLAPELSYAFNPLFKSDFKTISYRLHNIYANLGFGVRF